ncbi:hypothetical protein SLS58_010769 [Diplodia intermedia]|uniref:Uncharacterized protein n=1 Tax=Diplodia intermedia TaxID=856260 RepID=A0ABR3T3T4_9PEZI
MDKEKPRLFCGENGIETLDEGEKLRDLDKKAVGKYGAWVLPSYHPKGNKDDTKKISRKLVNKGKGFKGHDHPCKAGGDKVLAYTLNKGNSIFICNGGMEKEATLVALEEGKTMAKTLQKHRALSDTLLHEMFHLFEDSRSTSFGLTGEVSVLITIQVEDLRIVKFAHKSSDEPEWKDEDQKIPKRDEDPVYGYLQSYQLAKYVPADALGTPETFVWFAISVFNEDWKFEGKDGVAKKMEWKK